MSIVLLLKVVHVLAAITALGANVTYAFWLRQAGTKDRDRLVFTIASIRNLDNRISTPAYIVPRRTRQPPRAPSCSGSSRS